LGTESSRTTENGLEIEKDAFTVVGLIFPVPGPLDDPVDYAGYFTMIFSTVSKTLEK
jgi:hypothetical protein